MPRVGLSGRQRAGLAHHNGRAFSLTAEELLGDVGLRCGASDIRTSIAGGQGEMANLMPLADRYAAHTLTGWVRQITNTRH